MLLRCPNPECNKVLDAPDRLAGRHVKCPACGVRFYAPSTVSGEQKDPSVAGENPAIGERLPEATVVMGTPDADRDEMIGLKLGGCQIESKLGEGGMGAVYKAKHIGLDKDVAVKVVPRYLAEKSQQFVERFQREARAAARLDHPNIVKVHNVGEEQGHHFMVMEYIEGESLKEMLMREGKLDFEAAVSIFHQVLAALSAAHSKGIIHRDIKPDNILLRHLKPGETGSSIEMQRNLLGAVEKARTIAKVADLGLAKVQDSHSQGYTMSGVMLGTVDYMAPEQAEDAKNVDARADIYSLGCTFYHMLSGKKPYPGAAMMEVMMKHVTAPIPSVLDEREDVPADIDEIVKKMLAKKPDDRFETVAEIMNSLSGFVSAMSGEVPAMTESLPPDMVACPNTSCGKPNRRGAKWCAGCGEALVEKCLKCGEDVFLGETFCIHCGTNLEDEKKILDIVEEARSLLVAKRPRLVLDKLEEVFTLDPEREDALNVKERAEPIVSRIDALITRASESDEAEDFEAVQAALQEALELSPEEEDLQEQLSDIPEKILERDVRGSLRSAAEAWDEHRPHAAEQFYRKVITLDPDNDQAMDGIETCQALYDTIADKKDELNQLLDEKELNQAREVCLSILELDADDEEVQFKSKDLDDRFEEINEILSSAGILMQSQKWEEAGEAWQKVLDIWPTHAPATDGLQKAEESQSRFNELAERATRLAEEQDLGQAEEALQAALDAGHWEEGVLIIKAVREKKEEAEDLMHEAWDQFKKKDWVIAIEEFQKVLEAWPCHAAARKGLEDSESSLKEFQDLVEATKAPLESRSLADAENALIKALQAGHWEEGQRQLEQAEADLKQTTQLLKNAQTNVDSQNWSTALEALKEVNDLWPVHPTHKHLFEQAQKNEEVFRARREEAEALLTENKLSSAITALELALDAGNWPEGAKALLETQEHADAARKAAGEGEEEADARKWHQALQHLETAKALDEESVDPAQLEQVAKLAANLEEHINAVRLLWEQNKYEELLHRAEEASQIGADDEIERLKQQAMMKLNKVQELEAAASQTEAENNPNRTVEILSEALDIQPHREDIRRQRDRLEQRARQSHSLLSQAKESYRKKQWAAALHQANDALELDSHLQAAKDLAKQAKAATEGQEKKKKMMIAAAAVFALVVILGAYFSYRAQQNAIIEERRASVTKFMTAAGTNKELAEKAISAGDIKLLSARQNADEKAAQAASGNFGTAVGELKEALNKVKQAEAEVQENSDLATDLVRINRLKSNIQPISESADAKAAEAKKLQQSIQSFAKSLAAARNLKDNENWEAAWGAYSEAIQIATTANFGVEARKAADEEKETVATNYFQTSLDAGVKHKEEGALSQAKEEFETALAIATRVNRKDLTEQAQAAIAALDADEYSRLVRIGRQAAAEAQPNWAVARKAFQDAIAFATDNLNDEAKVGDATKMLEVLDRGFFRHQMSIGDALVKDQKWAEAGDAYEVAKLAAEETLKNKELVAEAENAIRRIGIQLGQARYQDHLKKGDLALKEGIALEQTAKKAPADKAVISFAQATRKLDAAKKHFEDALKVATETVGTDSAKSEATSRLKQATTNLASCGYQKAMVAGETSFAADDFAKALENFREAEQTATDGKLDQALIDLARQRRTKTEESQKGMTEYGEALQKAADEEKKKNWPAVRDAYVKAEKAAQKYQLPAKFLIQATSRGLEATYQSKMADAAAKEQEGDLQNAILTYRDAAKFAAQNRLASSYEKAATEKAQQATLKLGATQLGAAIEKAQEQEKQGDEQLKAKSYRNAAKLLGNALNGFQMAETSAKQRNLAGQLAKASAAVKRIESKLYTAEFNSEIADADARVAEAEKSNNDKKFPQASAALQDASRLYQKAKALAEQQKAGKDADLATQQIARIQKLLLSTQVDVALEQARGIEAGAQRISRADKFAEAASEFLKAQDACQKAITLAEKNGLADKKAESEKLKAAVQKVYFEQMYLVKKEAGAQMTADATDLIRQKEHLQAAKKLQLAAARFEEASGYAKEKKLAEQAVEASALAVKSQSDSHAQEYASLILKADELMLSAGVNAQGKEYDAAAVDYDKAGKLYGAAEKLSKEKSLDEALLKAAEAKAAEAEKNVGLQYYQASMLAGSDAETEKDWPKAKEAFARAVQMAKEKKLDAKLLDTSTAKLKRVSILAASTKDLQDKLDRGKLLLEQEKWQEAYELFAEAYEIASFANLKSSKNEAERSRLKAGKEVVKKLQAEAKKSFLGKRYQETIDQIKEAETIAGHISLARELLNELKQEREKSEKAMTAWKEYKITLDTGQAALKKGDWQTAGRNFTAAAKAAGDAGLGDDILSDAQQLARSANNMSKSVQEFAQLIEDGKAQEEKKDLLAAVETYTKAENIAASLQKSLGEQKEYVPTLTRMKADAAGLLEAVLPRVAGAQMKKSVEQGELNKKNMKWELALENYQQALRVAGSAGADKAGVDKLNSEIILLRKMVEGTQKFTAKMDAGARLHGQESWDDARSSYEEAVALAKEFGLPDSFSERANARIKGIAETRFTRLTDSARAMVNQGKFLEANRIYAEARALGRKESIDAAKLQELSTNVAAIKGKLLESIVYSRGDFNSAEAAKRQEETAQVLAIPARLQLPIANDTPIAFRLIPAGEFNMGSNDSEKGRDRDESVKGQGKLRIKISKPYYFSETEVTQVQWRTLMGNNPSKFKEGDDHPVENISWVDCQKFLEKLSAKTGRKCRMPTEAEWEAACRAGSTKQYWFGDRHPSVRQMAPYMWFSYNADQGRRKDEMFDPENPIKKWGRVTKVKHSPVGISIQYNRGGRRVPRKPNPYGLHDMHGNVFEWCLDWYDIDYFSLISKTDPHLKSVEKPKARAIRGGSAGCNLWWCRSAERDGEDPLQGIEDVGLRVLLEVD
ncbi:MAG: protein kinase [Planctomycetota bacterium]|jgi:formylglycine-generating enzyme required for sulfatase activity|nr:protein kinase [Planctomycetota bacterium]MDP7251032.1 protein kinase [Planctomycetota bacterium]